LRGEARELGASTEEFRCQVLTGQLLARDLADRCELSDDRLEAIGRDADAHEPEAVVLFRIHH
jgi:hypothetical protein